jgi:hypothetical protein
MPFQIVEITLDDADRPSSRKVVPYPFHGRDEAIANIKSMISKYEKHGYAAEQDYWWARAANGEHLRFIIEAI